MSMGVVAFTQNFGRYYKLPQENETNKKNTFFVHLFDNFYEISLSKKANLVDKENKQ